MSNVVPFVPRQLADIELAAWPRHLLPHVSASSIKQAFRCPEQFRRYRIQGDKEAPAQALTIGTAHHHSVEVNFEQKVESHTDLPISDVMDAARDKFIQEVDGKGGPAEYVDWIDAPETKMGEALDMAVRLSNAYHQQGAPRIQPVEVETSFELMIEGLPVPILGFIDCVGDIADPFAQMMRVAGDHVPEGLFERKIVEHKSAGRVGLSNENKTQGWVYQLARPLPITYDLAIKTKTPKIVVDDPRFQLELAPRPRTVALIAGIMRAIAHYYAVYGPDDPWPGAFGGFADTCGYCGFKPTCPWWTTPMWTPERDGPKLVDPLAQPDVPVTVAFGVHVPDEQAVGDE